MEWVAGGIILFYAGMLAFGLFGRGDGVGKLVKMLMTWLAIFAGAFLFFVYVDYDDVKQRVSSELSGTAIVEADGTVRIPMRDDGHFWVEGQVNGVPVEFLVDTGATITTIDKTHADAANLSLMRGVSSQVQTANGTVRVEVGRAETLAVGPIVEDDIVIQVSPIPGVNVLGMNYLQSLDRWSREGRYLILKR
ncbi:retropepsin-like aspartic protease family protein [Sphingomicrobium clamense]|uniref:TIGR02281 family clan AA aspartic protease n=1 Tax=Sphingomicrobium clamense TaxID=2851013 RepID=A0ABS6V6G6_9SPHN|nr:TIGR02281 family clan AA aspartic protease [Sphingomicrobium sp. B8]MBW0145161.1 TIGR02281 family clan AA aspartic protease [Sphingomicrobium sp. B8]